MAGKRKQIVRIKKKNKRAENRRRKKENVLAHLRSQARREPRGNVERLFAEGAGEKKEGKKKKTTKLCFFLSGTRGKRHFLVR